MDSIKHGKKITHKKNLIIAGVVLAVVLAAIFTMHWYNTKGPIPTDISRQLTYPIFYPEETGVTVKRATIRYDKQDQLISFTSLAPTLINLTFSEEPTPDQFNDISGYYQALLNNMNEYQETDTINGQVYLTKPESVNNNQVAVMNAKGTLMFVRAEKDLSISTWRQLFNNLIIVSK